MRLHTAVLAVLLALAAFPAAAQRSPTGGTLRPFGSAAALDRFLDSLSAEADAAAARADAVESEVKRLRQSGLLPALRPEIVHGAVADSLVVIAGVVRDAATGHPLPRAVAQVDATPRHARASPTGAYRIVLPAETPFAAVPLSVALLGYELRSRLLMLQPGDSVRLDVDLSPAVLLFDHLVAPGEGAEPGAPREPADEGGIVRRHGSHLVILHAGRLHTVAVEGGALRPVAAVDAWAPGATPAPEYQEMLVWGDRVVVLGHGEGRRTEIDLFRIGRDGGLRYESTHHLRSDHDHFRRYSARLVGGRLVLYTVLFVDTREGIEASLPALRRWSPGMGDDEGFRSLASPGAVFHPGPAPLRGSRMNLHAVTSCDLSRGALDCRATALLGPPVHKLLVSPTAFYVWPDGFEVPSPTVYRLPLNGASPTALRVSGNPWDQRAFVEDAESLHVLVVRGIVRRGTPSLLRVPLASFGDGSGAAPPDAYRALPVPDGGVTYRSRFVGGHLLYATGTGSLADTTSFRTTLHAMPLAGGDVSALPLPHGVERIEAMGRGAIAVGGLAGALHFTALRLDPLRATGTHVHSGATWGETRTLGWSYLPDGLDTGTFAVPRRIAERAASVLFVRNVGGELRALGELASAPPPPGRCPVCGDDASTRAVFLDGRVFALLGGELVEGEMRDGQLRELRRIRLGPPAPTHARR